MNERAKITFCGGADSVTGANFLIEISNKKILIDCGLAQDMEIKDSENWKDFVYDPKSIDMLFVTHAHIDHIGKIPKLIKEGFVGKIYSTPPTRALSLPMLLDTGQILSGNKKIDLGSIYNDNNIKRSFLNWEQLDYDEKINITDQIEVVFRNAGHILGSAMVEIRFDGKKILFTGDLGNSPSPLLPDTEEIRGIDYLVIESVYGDRNHESRHDRKRLLQKVIKENYARKGTLLIPTFSLERAQELLYEINDLVENKHIPIMPIFLDSPLAIHITEVFKQYKQYFNEKAQKLIAEGDKLFDFPGLKSTLKAEDSKMINESPSPKIIIAGSGMSSGGRIVHHERHFLPDPNNTILLTGYQSVGTVGRLISEGLKKIHITGEDVAVRARVEKIMGYSGHRDKDGLLHFVENMEKNLKKVFVVMGEPKSSLFLAQGIRDHIGRKIEVHTPVNGQAVFLDF